jgi:DnaK suppressor protein
MPDNVSPATLAFAAEWLAQRQAQLQSEIAASDPARARDDEPRSGLVHDGKDDADQALRASVDDAEVERDARELKAVHAAQHRIADGDYGTCEDCGELIDDARLRAQPATLRCAGCQRHVESDPRAAVR